MSFDRPFLENPSVLLLSLYHNAKQGITYIYKGLIFLGKATRALLMFILILIGLGIMVFIVSLLRLILYLFDWMKPNYIDILPRFKPRQKTL